MKEQEDSLERTDQEDDKITNKVEQWKETMTTTGQTQCGEVKTSVSNKLAQKEQKKFTPIIKHTNDFQITEMSSKEGKTRKKETSVSPLDPEKSSTKIPTNIMSRTKSAEKHLPVPIPRSKRKKRARSC